MKQRAEVASQILRFVESKRTTLFEASKDDLCWTRLASSSADPTVSVRSVSLISR
jgi:hypothetical protein